MDMEIAYQSVRLLVIMALVLRQEHVLAMRDTLQKTNSICATPSARMDVLTARVLNQTCVRVGKDTFMMKTTQIFVYHTAQTNAKMECAYHPKLANAFLAIA